MADLLLTCALGNVFTSGQKMVEWNQLDVASFLEQATGFLAEHGQLDGPSCHAPPAKRARSVGLSSHVSSLTLTFVYVWLCWNISVTTQIYLSSVVWWWYFSKCARYPFRAPSVTSKWSPHYLKYWLIIRHFFVILPTILQLHSLFCVPGEFDWRQWRQSAWGSNPSLPSGDPLRVLKCPGSPWFPPVRWRIRRRAFLW